MVNKDIMYDMLVSGKTLQEIGNYFGVTRERIRQLRNKWFPKLKREDYGSGLKTKKRVLAKTEHILKTYGRLTWKYGSDIEQAIAKKISRKKINARRDGIEFSVDISKLYFPIYCPVLGIKLDYFSEKTAYNSPSFDRIDPTKGYVDGNVQIISHQANSKKRGHKSQGELC